MFHSRSAEFNSTDFNYRLRSKVDRWYTREHHFEDVTSCGSRQGSTAEREVRAKPSNEGICAYGGLKENVTVFAEISGFALIHMNQRTNVLRSDGLVILFKQCNHQSLIGRTLPPLPFLS